MALHSAWVLFADLPINKAAPSLVKGRWAKSNREDEQVGGVFGIGELLRPNGKSHDPHTARGSVCCVAYGIVPPEWKRHWITSVWKKKRDQKDHNNYGSHRTFSTWLKSSVFKRTLGTVGRSLYLTGSLLFVPLLSAAGIFDSNCLSLGAISGSHSNRKNRAIPRDPC